MAPEDANILAAIAAGKLDGETLAQFADRARRLAKGSLDALMYQHPKVRLLPCPFCGGEARVHDDVGPKDWMVACRTCDGNTTLAATAEEAAQKWNRRVPAESTT